MANSARGKVLTFSDLEGESTHPSVPKTTWNIHLATVQNTYGNYAYFDPDGNKFGVGNVTLGEHFTDNKTAYFDLINVEIVGPGLVTGNIKTYALISTTSTSPQSIYYYLTLQDDGSNLSFATENETGGVQKFSFKFDDGGDNFSISCDLQSTTYDILIDTNGILMPFRENSTIRDIPPSFQFLYPEQGNNPRIDNRSCCFVL